MKKGVKGMVLKGMIGKAKTAEPAPAQADQQEEEKKEEWGCTNKSSHQQNDWKWTIMQGKYL